MVSKPRPLSTPSVSKLMFGMHVLRALPTKCPHKHFVCAESFGANAISKYIANRTPSDCSPLDQSRIYKTSICVNRPMAPKPNLLRPRQGDGGETGRKRKNGYARGMRQRRKKHSRPSLEFVQDEDSRPKHRNQNIRECSKLAPDKRGCQKLGICIG